jgi:hypothetical protein
VFGGILGRDGLRGREGRLSRCFLRAGQEQAMEDRRLGRLGMGSATGDGGAGIPGGLPGLGPETTPKALAGQG